MRPRSDLSVVIPVRDDAQRLRACLSSLRAQPGGADVSVIVADNGSTDDSAAVARSFGGVVLDLPGVSVAQMRNRAVSRAQTVLVALVDADHLLSEGWLAACLQVMEDPTVAAAGAPYDSPRPGTWVQRAYDRFRSRATEREDTEWLGSGNLVLRREVFTTIGGFDESLETCEDVDLCNRLRRAGLRLVTEPAMRSVHLGDPATLRALFMSELWRGRDNVRVSLRGPLTWRALPSLVITIGVLVCVLVLLVAPLVAVWLGLGTGAALAGVSLLLIAAAVTLRAGRMSRRDTTSASDLLGNVAVATVYEVARALALVMRASHGTRRRGEGRRA